MLILEWWKSNNDDFQIKEKSGFLGGDFLEIMVKMKNCKSYIRA